MIPKVIHYCWFGAKEKPKSVQRCITSWRKYCPDYEIKEWNEDNFDVNMMPYTRDAYQAGKYAFVSDVARFWVLYHKGGVYFDTDVEVIRPIDELVERGPFMGWEKPDALGNIHVAPGLGLAAPKGFFLYKEILDGFSALSYYLEDGQWNPYTMIPLVTDLLLQKGLKLDGTLQNVNVNDNANSSVPVDVPVDVPVVTIYPADYLCPMDSLTGKIELTNNTHTIHHYSMSWLPKITQWRVRLMRRIRTIT
ncbi:MAG: glycosyl transferase [Prevotella sp.]|nr:glycosyl transferase [Prevotella sp.]